MSKENAIQFLILRDKDETIKSAFDAIMAKVDEKKLSWDKAIQEEIIPLAKKHGYGLLPEDFKELQKTVPETLEDEELDMVAGGRGQIDEYCTGPSATILANTVYCNCAPDNQTFITRYNIYSDNHCPDFSFIGHGRNQRICPVCKNMNVTIFYNPVGCGSNP